MDYYEEFGVSPSASPDEIRKAHRRLSKLVHPDQQVDPALKALAETQMRRLNAMASVLLSSERRRQYDRQQRLPDPSRARGLSIGQTVYIVPARPLARSAANVASFPPRGEEGPLTSAAAIRAGYRTPREVVLWSVMSASAAVLLTLSGVWAWSGEKLGASEKLRPTDTASYVLVEADRRADLGPSSGRCEPTPAERAILESSEGTKWHALNHKVPNHRSSALPARGGDPFDSGVSSRHHSWDSSASDASGAEGASGEHVTPGH